MTSWGTQQIETFQLVQYADEAGCFICDGPNRRDADLCRHCGAPLALAFPADTDALPRHLVAVLGTPSCGKTVYLGMLTDILSRKQDSLQILARGAYSVALQQGAMAELARRRFPASTQNSPQGWNWVHCEVSGLPKERRVDLILPDLSGEAFLGELRNTNETSVVRPFLTKCAAAMLLIDTERIEQGDQEQEFLAIRIVSYLSGLIEKRRKGWMRRPVAVVFAKADRSEACAANPAEYAQQCTPGLWKHCLERLKRHEFFAASVVGSCAEAIVGSERVRIPLRVEPHGVVAPFEWLMHQI